MMFSFPVTEPASAQATTVGADTRHKTRLPPSEDDGGRWWSLLREVTHSTVVVPGAVLVAGTERFWSVVRIEQVDDGARCYFVAVPADDPGALRLLARWA